MKSDQSQNDLIELIKFYNQEDKKPTTLIDFIIFIDSMNYRIERKDR